MIGRLTDLTRKGKISESELLLAKNEAEKANKLKSEFIANISHEIKTPMSSILGYTELLKEEEDDPEKKEKLNIILNAGNMLLALINDLLDFSKFCSIKMLFSNCHYFLQTIRTSCIFFCWMTFAITYALKTTEAWICYWTIYICFTGTLWPTAFIV